MEILPYAKLFRVAARFHDIGFLNGWSEDDKKRIDLMFLRLMLAVSKNSLQRFFAYLYYYLVHYFWFLFFRYKKLDIIKIYVYWN